MNLTSKLIGYLNRVFSKDPIPALALRMRYDGAMTWRVSDGVLTTATLGGTGSDLTIDLATMTVAQLASYLAAQPGYSVPYASAELSGLLSTVLLDGSSNQDASNGDHLNAYTSMVWAFLDSKAGQLRLLKLAVDEALAQMAAPTAAGEWVDEHGSFYAVPRLPGEGDASYAARMVAEVGKARGTPVAIGAAVRVAADAMSVSVTNYDTVTVAADTTPSYGLFDVNVVLDAENLARPFDQIDPSVRSTIESMRDAGMHLRVLRYTMVERAKLYIGATLSISDVIAFDGVNTPVVNPVDPYRSSVVFDLRGTGANGSTTFNDISNSHHPLTNSGNVKVNTAVAVIGSGSIEFDGTSDWIQTTSGLSDFAFGTGDFTVEFWFRGLDAKPMVLLDFYNTGNTGCWQVYLDAPAFYGSDTISWWSSNTLGVKILDGTFNLRDGVWHHIAITRASGVTRFFIDGSLKNSVSDTRNYSGGVSTFAVGAQVTNRNAAYDAKAFLDLIRITKGVARYTSNFTPATTPYPTI